MKGKMILAAVAACWWGNSVPAAPLADRMAEAEGLPADTLMPKNQKKQYGRSEEQEKLAGLLGSLLGKGATGAKEHGDTIPPRAGEQSSEQSGKRGVGDWLGTLLGDTALGKLTPQKLSGTWGYMSTKCIFKSDNVVKKVGSEVMAAPLEKKLNDILAKVGMKEGSYSLTFNEDGTFRSELSGHPLSGKYELDEANKTVTLLYLGGLLKTTMEVSLVNRRLSLVYEADKLLLLLETISSKSGARLTKGAGALLGSYDGMKLGLEFVRAEGSE